MPVHTKNSSNIELPPPDEWGPHMQALSSDAQRRFVMAMLVENNPSSAARRAGYSDDKGGNRVRAHHLMQNGEVLAALHEVSWKGLNGIAIKAIAALDRVVSDPDHPKHLIAVQMTLDRTGFAAQTEHKVTVEHKVDDLQLKALAARFAHDTGVPMQKLLGFNDVIDGEFEPVTETVDAAGTPEGPDLAGGKTEVQ